MPTISDLFNLKYGHSLELNRLEQSNNSAAVNFVGRAARNNGVTAHVCPIAGLAPAAAGTISVALGGQGGAGVAFVQPSAYYCGRDVMILTAKKPMTEQQKLWWATCITANRFRFGFGRQANRTLRDLNLPPVTDMPAWVTTASTEPFKGAELPASEETLDLSEVASWKQFTLQRLFDIRKGQRLTKANMTCGDTPFIGAIDNNNGVSAFVGKNPIHHGNTISVTYNGSVAEAFYQPVDFWACDDVNVLYPKFQLTPDIAMFLVAVIRREKYRFHYGRKWHLERMAQSIIRLPAVPSGEPDWPFIARYIRTLPFSSHL